MTFSSLKSVLWESTSFQQLLPFQNYRIVPFQNFRNIHFWSLKFLKFYPSTTFRPDGDRRHIQEFQRYVFRITCRSYNRYCPFRAVCPTSEPAINVKVLVTVDCTGVVFSSATTRGNQGGFSFSCCDSGIDFVHQITTLYPKPKLPAVLPACIDVVVALILQILQQYKRNALIFLPEIQGTFPAVEVVMDACHNRMYFAG